MVCSLLLSVDLEYLSCKLKQTLFEASIGCGIFGKAFFTGFLWAHNQDLRTVILKESDPYCQPLFILIYTCVFFLFALHLFIFPLSHLSSHFLSSSSPLCISLPCHSLQICVTHTWWQSLIIYSIGRKVKQQSAAWWELHLSVCSFIHI